MEEILTEKFSQNEHLKQFLLNTGNKELVEGNPKDTHWACGLSIDDKNIWNKEKWTGENQLGKILGKIRSAFQNS